MNVSALLIRFWPLLRPIVLKGVVIGLRRLGEEAKSNTLHSDFAPFAVELDNLCDLMADAIEGKPNVLPFRPAA